MTERCLCGHLRPKKTLLWPRDSQSERNCHFSRSWRCQRPPAGGWHWWSDPPESPAKARAVLTSGAWEFLTWQPTCWPGNQTHLHFAWSWFLLLLLPSDCNCCKVLDDTFRVHSLSCPGFSAVKQLSNICENLSSMTSETASFITLDYPMSLSLYVFVRVPRFFSSARV